VPLAQNCHLLRSNSVLMGILKTIIRSGKHSFNELTKIISAERRGYIEERKIDLLLLSWKNVEIFELAA